MMALRQQQIAVRAFRAADGDGNATIDFDEFAQWVRGEPQLLRWVENLGRYWAKLASATELHTDPEAAKARGEATKARRGSLDHGDTAAAARRQGRRGSVVGKGHAVKAGAVSGKREAGFAASSARRSGKQVMRCSRCRCHAMTTPSLSGGRASRGCSAASCASADLRWTSSTSPRAPRCASRSTRRGWSTSSRSA
jgi:hypothetical protein